MPDHNAAAPSPALNSRVAWAMLLALAGAFTLSQAFRTVASIMGPPLARELSLSPQQLGMWAAAFHFTFGAMQLVMGVSIDLFGVRRTIMTAFPMAIAGAAISANAQSYGPLLLGQILIGTGCAPAFLVCTVFISRHFQADRFTSISGLIMSVSSVGVLATSTPMAWLIEISSWRWSFAALGILAVTAWGFIWWLVREPVSQNTLRAQERPNPLTALREMLALFKLPHTPGLIAFAAVAYAGFITLRGLWLGPLLIERHDFSLVQTGNVALVMTLASMLSPAVFGRIDPGGIKRVRWMLVLSVVSAILLATMGLLPLPWVDVGFAIGYGLLSGYGVLQYGYVHNAYPANIRGRALSLFTMAMFLGISLMQWVTGIAASLAQAAGVEPFTVVLLTMSGMLLAGTLAFWKLPQQVNAS
ncbi:MAG: MFS transporter [Ottowia sp.]|uniref:MFS transporter n=1 Tax=unclassified Ottowia TaxID=2645081 RepID=UPI003C2BBC95